MTPSIWLALASLCAGLFVQVAVFAFMLGRLSQRVTTLERDGSALQGIRDAVTKLTVQMDTAQGDISHISRDVSGLQRSLSNIVTDRASKALELPSPPRQRRRGTPS
ncbi:hypothetical protein [Brevundimonas pondensis]|uniref:DUF948 domain-containing protein n=1 Tax=Brevundimonas pondensis TaxID=2774189 RepID=A0ABX7SJY8_9CAUL|nr:hypothetical protein [Brevundimonas pondensis]QTC88012.1 hypothetical protein IFE19_00970 [Brevundimonas pondensis]